MTFDEIVAAVHKRQRRLHTLRATHVYGETRQLKARAKDVPIRWGDFDRLTPFNETDGTGSARRIDEAYVQRFLLEHADDVRGEVRCVTRDQLLGNSVADAYDCVIVPHVLHATYRMREALWDCVRSLRTGGVLLATFPVTHYPAPVEDQRPDYWRFTAAAVRRVVAEFFSGGEHQRAGIWECPRQHIASGTV